ncbi:hypothetical protein RA263_02575 [Pseudomonas syringae pv. tagetis]|uniref:Uncharacterized protein n=2 Tax=Pseudomonas syringae group genomosp. 7 TaxID=251699 RepID=A0A0Q0E794_9PSED|nr:hypothetical protein [Pseudomonas syringae group genomosp. 7]KPX40985.1 putative proteinral secretion pathway protein L [Pseudomonas syringae pv. helianthi]KPY82246.1 putative proteinral secretion pathway protein L [Pseudomonas syringae pv. tagetis]RMW27580.1 putative proteinral secretion pathway protein L [Pseudomonas syringae pv. tagetis]UNB61767.1 hypothetical protein MME54_19285 [Pseudomonas syringae pv. helianthi]UNB70016.1 hypothetical protein MME58_07220 [Pseudomonas syringae pv. tag
MEINGSAEVAICGQGAMAGALIVRSAECHWLENPPLQGVIQPYADIGTEHFSLYAHLHQEAANAPITDIL